MENINRLEEIIKIELEGVSRTIIEYSTDVFVVNYAEKLCDLEIRNNPVLLKYLVTRINEWYSLHLDEIQMSKYVQHKALHTKSYEIIKELNDLM